VRGQHFYISSHNGEIGSLAGELETTAEVPVRYVPTVDSDGTDQPPETGHRWPGRGAAIYGVSLAVLAAPLLIGSGPAWAQVVSVSLVFVTTALFMVGRRFRVRAVPFALPAALAAGMTALQLLPLPAAVVRLLSPRTLELRAEAEGAIPAFLPLTLDVPATVLEVSKAMAGLALLLIVGNSARRSSRASPLLLTLAFVGAVISIIHVVQRLTGATHILGVYAVRDLPGSGFFGTFVNGNQAASLLTLSALIAAGLALRSHGALRIAAATSATLSVAVVLWTGSRAGILALGLGGGLFIGLMLSRRFGPGRGALLALALLVAGGGFTLWASEGVRARVASTASDRLSDQKIRGWRDTQQLVRAYPLTGVGRGAFEAPASAFRADEEGVRLAYPENIALQLLSEWGIPFTLALLLAAMVAAARFVRVVPRLDPSSQAAACAVVAVLVHELADFGLELPGVAFPTVAALGLVVARGEQFGEHRRDYGRRLGARWVTPALAGWGLALAAAAWALPHTLLADGLRMRALVVKKDPAALAQLDAAIRRHPADYYLELMAGTLAMSTGHESTGRHLNRAQRLNPTTPTAHLVTAGWLARSGRRSQAALEFRLAAEHTGATSLDELWARVGPRYIGDAVPQTDDRLLAVAAFLLGKGDLARAREVSARAVAAGGHREGTLLVRLQLAKASRSRAFMEEAARELLERASEPASYIAAAEALSQIGQPAAADRAIEDGLTSNPHDSELILAGSRLRMGRGDLIGAAGFLRRRRDDSLTINDRIQFDELEAAIAEKAGDTVGAATLHTRAKNLAKLKANPDQNN
jgi:O-antigen ligase